MLGVTFFWSWLVLLGVGLGVVAVLALVYRAGYRAGRRAVLRLLRRRAAERASVVLAEMAERRLVLDDWFAE